MAIGPGASGSRTLGRYELIQELAKSQIGPLWVAHVPGGELCTIRRVSTAPPVTGEEKDALSEGAWWTLEVQHPTIMHGKDVVMSEGELGIVTEYVEGEVLRSVLRLSSFKRKPIPVNAALRIGLDLLEALHEAGAQAQPLSDGKSSYAQGGLVPDSVMIGSDGKTRLLDVGVAGACAGVSTIARNPEMVAYSAPEHIDAKPLDIRANVYAVGVMLWEMLAGKRLYVGSTHSAVVERIKAGDPPRLDASKPVGGEPIPAAVADVIARAIESDPEKRYESPQAMSEALAGAAPAASHTDVAALIDDLAGNTLATRRKVIERATKPGAAPARAAMPTAPALKPQPKPAPAADSPKPPAAAEPPSPPAEGRREAPPPPARARKQTLLGIAPPPPRAQVEWIESEDLESISKIQAVPIEPTEGALVAALTSDESPKPKPAEAADADAPATHLKTQMLGTPAAALVDAPDEKEKPKDAIPAPFTFGALGAAEAKESEPEEDVPVSLEPESIQESELVPESLPEAQAPRVPIAAAGDDDAADADSDARSSDDESAVAWLGPPPGVALDEPEGERVDKERKKKMMKIVGGVTAGAAAMLLLALAFGTGKPEETPTESQPPAANTAPAETAKPEPPKPPEPQATAKEPEPPKEEPKEEPKPEPEPEPEPEPKAEAPAPKPVAKSTTTWRPKTTTTTRTTSTKTSSKPKPKPKPSFTPSGI